MIEILMILIFLIGNGVFAIALVRSGGGDEEKSGSVMASLKYYSCRVAFSMLPSSA